MIEQYKVGDRVLWDAKIGSIATNGKIWITSMADESRGICSIDPKEIRPYTPRQEFENGEVVEVSHDGNEWFEGLYVGKFKSNDKAYISFRHTVAPYYMGEPISTHEYQYCRKIQKPQHRETITIGGVDYYKDDVEKALKDLKPVEGK